MKGPAEAVAPGTVVSRSPHGRGRWPRSLPGSSARSSRSVSEMDTVEGQTSHQEEKRLASRQQGTSAEREKSALRLCTAPAGRGRQAGGLSEGLGVLGGSASHGGSGENTSGGCEGATCHRGELGTPGSA